MYIYLTGIYSGCPYLLGRYFNACNTINNQNMMRQSDTTLEKYWVTQSGYFILATTVALGIGITDGNLLFCHGISEESTDKKISTIEYNNRTVYECFNNPFPDYFCSPYLNINPITIDDRPCLHKISCYTPDLLPSAISVASGNSVSNLTAPPDSPHLLLLTSDDPNPPHVIKKNETYRSRVKRGYYFRKYYENIL